ncbi:MAG: DUF885 family protein [Deltaproteobacteria bacterium]|nr:DUF885 family protein [Deltaproteobacteria bacterium]MBW2071401.1 DUF885 family protein [Deltaproteobacteria bacterium]
MTVSAVHTLATDYFEYLARCFPVMCASDEFHFLPRAQAARRYYEELDDLGRQKIQEVVAALRRFKEDFRAVRTQERDLEAHLDKVLLLGSVAGVLLEFAENRSWQHNPLLYLKIAFIGLDHALTKPAAGSDERRSRVESRLSTIPRLLHQGKENIKSVPASYHQAALLMIGDCRAYLEEISAGLAAEGGRTLQQRIEAVAASLAEFASFLTSLSPVPDKGFSGMAVERTLREHFLSNRSLPEVFQIAQEEWRENLEELERLRHRVDSSKSWQSLYQDYFPAAAEERDTITLYRQEVESLQQFFLEQGLGLGMADGGLLVCETPRYLKSVRSAASFAAAFSDDAAEKDYFYITTTLPGNRAAAATDLLRKRLHKEFKFLTAHETIPGHYLLDAMRRTLANPVRRQIESPLFYEGWAYYAESLLGDYGYVESSLDKLVDCKRRLWRAARCQIDVGLATGLLSFEQGVQLLTTTGFSPEEAVNQIHRFRLNPGYQLCYTLGRFEIMKLKEKYGRRFGNAAFHHNMLTGGELPFHLIDKRFASMDGRGKEHMEE